MANVQVENGNDSKQRNIPVRLHYRLTVKLEQSDSMKIGEQTGGRLWQNSFYFEDRYFGIFESILAYQLDSTYDIRVVGAEPSECDPRPGVVVEILISKPYLCPSSDYTKIGDDTWRLKKRPLKAQQRLFEEDVRKRIEAPHSIEELKFTSATSREFSIRVIYDAQMEIVLETTLGGADLALRLIEIEQHIIRNLSNQAGVQAKLRFKRLPAAFQPSSSGFLAPRKKFVFPVELTGAAVIPFSEMEMSCPNELFYQTGLYPLSARAPRPAFNRDDYLNKGFADPFMYDFLGSYIDEDATIERFKLLDLRVPDEYELYDCIDSLEE